MEFREANRFRVHQLRAGAALAEIIHQLSVPCGLKQHAFGCEAGTKSHGASPPGKSTGCNISLKTNMTVADDMLPNRRNTSREWRSVSSERPTLFCTASRIVRPPDGWPMRNIFGPLPTQDTTKEGGEPLANCRRTRPQAPYRNRVANMPGNLIGAIRKNCRREALQFNADRLSRHQTG